MSIFQTRNPAVAGNQKIRVPQQEAFAALGGLARTDPDEREVGIVLPVGCGKSGCIALAPFAFRSSRTLVVAPGMRIAQQLHEDFNPSGPKLFYQVTDALAGRPYPESVEIRGRTTNLVDLGARIDFGLLRDFIVEGLARTSLAAPFGPQLRRSAQSDAVSLPAPSSRFRFRSGAPV